MRQRGSALLFGVLAAWALAVALVGIGGEFPLSDDWAYAHVVRSLGQGRGFDFLPWTGASLVLQALYGAAACKLTGFSHETLRATTLAVSVIGLVSFHALLRRLGASACMAAAGCAVLAFSPLWFNLSFTFMTDVPFAALAIMAAWLYVGALGERSRSGLLAAGAVAAACFLVRQHALSIAVAAAAAALWPPPVRDSRRPLRERALDATAALALPLAVASTYFLWAATGAHVPLAVHNKLGEALTTSPLAMAGAAFRGLATLGFLFAPWALTVRPQGRGEQRIFAGVFAGLVAIAAFVFAREGASMFYLTNVLGDYSIGAVTTRDALFLARPAGPAGGAAFHLLLTAASLASAAALVTRLATAVPAMLRRPASLDDAAPALFCVLALVLSALGTLAQAHYYFDRYLLVLLPLAIASVVAVSPSLQFGSGAAVVLAAFAYYSVAGTHDYLEWNRARWQMLAALESSGVTPRQVDGGVEYNATRLAAELRTAPTDAQARSGQAASAKSWWWVVDDEWVVAFGPLDGYAEVDSRNFTRWLPPGQGHIVVLRRPGSIPALAPEGAGVENGGRAGSEEETR
jgi:hypothetical protein